MELRGGGVRFETASLLDLRYEIEWGGLVVSINQTNGSRIICCTSYNSERSEESHFPHPGRGHPESKMKELYLRFETASLLEVRYEIEWGGLVVSINQTCGGNICCTSYNSEQSEESHFPHSRPRHPESKMKELYLRYETASLLDVRYEIEWGGLVVSINQTYGSGIICCTSYNSEQNEESLFPHSRPRHPESKMKELSV